MFFSLFFCCFLVHVDNKLKEKKEKGFYIFINYIYMEMWISSFYKVELMGS